MSQPPDPLDAELSALRPREISPGLRARVSDRLTGPPTGRQWPWGIALAAALAAGAIGYVTKQRLPMDLEHAVREAHAGRRFVSPLD